MSRYLKPRIRVIRRLGKLSGLTKKKTNRKNRPGEHSLKPKRTLSGYGLRLQEKQKLRFNYGISENKLYNLIKKARKMHGSTSLIILQLLEMRLDNILYRLGIGATIPDSRQIVNHNHILINNKMVNIPSFLCKKGDIINIKPTSKPFIQTKLIATLIPSFLTFDKNTLQGTINNIITRSQINFIINELLVIEYYSRK